ncbi:hypothetical protein CJ20_190 [Escherichia phage CJ20]|nr:hypothetical protein CJ20_190 [Escherichia phage CJ20]
MLFGFTGFRTWFICRFIDKCKNTHPFHPNFFSEFSVIILNVIPILSAVACAAFHLSELTLQVYISLINLFLLAVVLLAGLVGGLVSFNGLTSKKNCCPVSNLTQKSI